VDERLGQIQGRLLWNSASRATFRAGEEYHGGSEYFAATGRELECLERTLQSFPLSIEAPHLRACLEESRMRSRVPRACPSESKPRGVSGQSEDRSVLPRWDSSQMLRPTRCANRRARVTVKATEDEACTATSRASESRRTYRDESGRTIDRSKEFTNTAHGARSGASSPGSRPGRIVDVDLRSEPDSAVERPTERHE
jgi:hypothetical protein